MKELSGFKKGVNLGGWLSQCDYSRERLEGFITEDDIIRIAMWGADHVRIPFDYNIITDSYGNNLHPDKGQHLDYLGEEGDFYLVRFNGNSVYISKKHSYVAY